MNIQTKPSLNNQYQVILVSCCICFCQEIWTSVLKDQHQPITTKRQMEDGDGVEEPGRSARRLFSSRRGGGDRLKCRTVKPSTLSSSIRPLYVFNTQIGLFLNGTVCSVLWAVCPRAADISKPFKFFYSSKQIRSKLKPLILSGDCVPGRSSHICSGGKQVSF